MGSHHAECLLNTRHNERSRYGRRSPNQTPAPRSTTPDSTLAKGSGYAKDGPGEGDTPGTIHTFLPITVNTPGTIHTFLPITAGSCLRES